MPIIVSSRRLRFLEKKLSALSDAVTEVSTKVSALHTTVTEHLSSTDTSAAVDGLQKVAAELDAVMAELNPPSPAPVVSAPTNEPAPAESTPVPAA